MRPRVYSFIAVTILGGCRHAASPTDVSAPRRMTDDVAPRSTPAVRWLRGQLHVHSNRSGDSETPPEIVARWYQNHHYDFIVFTDHNAITRLDWPGPMRVFAGVELTQNYRTCAPPPLSGMSCLLHMNALFVSAAAPLTVGFPDPTDLDRGAILRRAIEQGRALGGVLQMNHPDFHYALDATLLTALAREGVPLVEVANEAIDSNNQGDATHPSTEALWDAVLTAGATMYATATDDAHHYDDAETVRARGEMVFTGDRGWVMVRATLDERSIREALTRGDFYASNGVVLSRVVRASPRIEIEVDASSPGEHRFEFIGAGGQALATMTGRSAVFSLDGVASPYVRAVVTDGAGHRAWVQPVRRPP